jgi:hypothetical protein
MKLNKKVAKSTSNKVYIIDFLNIFSDYREMKYLKTNVDFHKVKHNNIEKDTYEFFEMFFGIYIKTLNISKNGRFIFILKSIPEYEILLPKIMEKYIKMDIRFITVMNKMKEVNMDKNKDDFVCQYFYHLLSCDNTLECILVSNDLYRDRLTYIKKYINLELDITVLRITNKKINKTESKMTINHDLANKTKDPIQVRNNIPKFELIKLL